MSLYFYNLFGLQAPPPFGGGATQLPKYPMSASDYGNRTEAAPAAGAAGVVAVPNVQVPAAGLYNS